MDTLFIGLDAGSVSVKLVTLDSSGRVLNQLYKRHKGRPIHASLELLREVLQNDSSINNRPVSLSVTGSAGRLIGEVLSLTPVNEVVAHAFATRRLYPHIRTIIELGGEDSKLIFLDNASAGVKDFSMNSVCAAGTGSFLDQQAERLRLSIEELSELSLRSKNPPRIAGRCSVFAKSDMIHLQQIAAPVEDIVSGLCFAVARNFKGSIARGRDVVLPVSFQGGVAANKGMVRAFKEIFGFEDLFVPDEFAVMGAIGAALKNIESGECCAFDLSRLDAYLNSGRQSEKGHAPLLGSGDDFLNRHGAYCESKQSEDMPSSPRKKIRAYLGVDIGSISTNLAVIDEDGNLLAKRYLMTAGRPIEAVQTGLEEIGQETAHLIEVAGVGTTGSGRYMIADFIGADIVKNEITAQATAASFIDNEVDTIFEIGGQDSKYISLKNGIIVDFEMNKACAAGTGSFIEEQAEKLSISVKNEFAKSAFISENPCRLGERCTVFMENSLMANLQRGTKREDLLAGLSYSIVQNYINRVVCKRPVGDRIFFQGGVAFNKSVVAAFEKYLDKKIIVPPNHDVTGAIGMALIAMRHMKSSDGAESAFKGFELSKRKYDISSFECKGCPNVCEINRISIDGEKGNLFYGGRCEKYDVRKKKGHNALPDLFAFREEKLWEAHQRYVTLWDEKKSRPSGNGRPAVKIGIPYIFYFHDFLPYWATLLWELGFDVEVSPKTDRSIIDLGLESVLAETCFPVKAAHGHIRHLLEKGIDTLFIPSFVNLNRPDSAFDRGFACPYTQTIPYMARTAFEGIKALTPVIDLNRDPGYLRKEIQRVFKPFGISSSEITKAMKAAGEAQDEFIRSIKGKGKEVLSSLNERAVVIVGRAYNSFDRGLNLEIPKKLADLGVISLPMDFLPIEDEDVSGSWPNMYWRAGQRILSAARLIKSSAHLHAIYIGNFSCGPDSFIIKFFEEELATKPYLHLELDAHSADAGAITRCEAFLDSISSREKGQAPFKDEIGTEKPKGPVIFTSRGKRTIYIPRMSDHAFALAAAFNYCGVDAEVLPESTQESVDIGKKYVSGKECYPCAVTTGDMVKKTMGPGFRPESSAFFMPSGSGPCRFGQYNVFHRQVIKELGIDDLPVFSPNQDENFYEELGIVGSDFAMRSWEGIVAIELLRKCLYETRPYEVEKGEADSIYAGYLPKAYESIRGTNGKITDLLVKAKKDFEGIRRVRDERPLIGVVGEIFVRSNRFSNEHLSNKIEALGGEVYLTPVSEWIYYINLMGIRRLKTRKDWSPAIKLMLKRYFQKRTEHKLEKSFKGFLKTLHEPDTLELMEIAAPYIHPSFEGEAILSIGKSIDMVRRLGVSGIVNAMPFGCMPGTIVSGLARGLNADLGIPFLTIPYDGTESPTTIIQLEAFMDQARERHAKRQQAGPAV